MRSSSMTLQCWHCEALLEGILLPFSRHEECPHCKSDLHVCMACKNYSPSLTSSCKEDKADFIVEREKANFCDFFFPNPTPCQQSSRSEADVARAQLAQLFGETTNIDADPTQRESEADKALAELKRLFGEE